MKLMFCTSAMSTRLSVVWSQNGKSAISSMFSLCSVFLMWRPALLSANRLLNEWGGWDWRWRITLDRLFCEPYSTSSQLHYNFIHWAQVTIILPLTWFKCFWEQRRLLSYSLQMEGHNSITLPERNWFHEAQPLMSLTHKKRVWSVH